MSTVIKLIVLLSFAALPCAAQFRSIKIRFQGTGCASCTESMPDRLRRLRGVESASVNVQEGLLEVRLAEQNRIRVEQIRDLIEQDGTKATQASVRVRGDLAKMEDRWVLRPAGSAATYEVTGSNLSPGVHEIAGEIHQLHTTPLQIKKTD